MQIEKEGKKVTYTEKNYRKDVKNFKTSSKDTSNV